MAASIGLRIVFLDYLLTTCVSLVVVSAVSMVGVILVVGLLITPAAKTALLQALKDMRVQPAMTYLANTISLGKNEIPYSTITAIDFADQPPLGPLVNTDGQPIGPLEDNQIVLNAWAAADLGAKPGDTIRVTYFDPRSAHGVIRERVEDFELAGVAKLAGAADDPHLTPEVDGVTDQAAIADWDPPFPFKAQRIRDKDEVYWEEHRATPKAFVALSTGQRLWGSRFGDTTSIRFVPAGGVTAANLRRELAPEPAAMGLVFQPVKQQGLAASAGATPYGILFLAFSSFIIAAAVMLVALLFRLGIDGRTRELGILGAVGFPRHRIGWLLSGEGLIVAGAGSLVGVGAGLGYAAIMLAGLQIWWLAAVVTPFLQLHVDPLSLLVGFAGGLVTAWATIAWTVRRAGRLPPQQLLAGRIGQTGGPDACPPLYMAKIAWVMLGAAVVAGLATARIGEELRAGVFFGVGALVLVAGLVLIWTRLERGATGAAVTVGGGNLPRLALRNAARHPARSTLSVGLIASACFLIVAVSAFRLDPSGQLPRRDSGDGGFALIAQSDQPVHYDLNTSEGRAELGFSEKDSKLLSQSKIFSLPIQPGDDATCLNLYRPRQPRMMGMSKALVDRGGFTWAGSLAASPDEEANPWLLLQKDLGRDRDGAPLVPVILEKNTATYSLHLWSGPGEVYQISDAQGRTIRLVVVALLSGSIFQGDLLLSEENLLHHFPEVSGRRYFLLQTPPEQVRATTGALDRTLGDYGLVSQTTAGRLAELLAVQNTYLSTFQSLGGLGLLLGTLGLAAVQLRNVLERQGELALLRAAGFRRAMLALLVVLENGALLLAGLGVGLVAALVAVLPHLLSGGAAIPWLSLAGTLALVLAVGLLAGLAAVRRVLKAPLLPALRNE